MKWVQHNRYIDLIRINADGLVIEHQGSCSHNADQYPIIPSLVSSG